MGVTVLVTTEFLKEIFMIFNFIKRFYRLFNDKCLDCGSDLYVWDPRRAICNFCGKKDQ